MERLIEYVIDKIDDFSKDYKSSPIADDLVQMRIKFPTWFETRFQTIKHTLLNENEQSVSFKMRSGKFSLRIICSIGGRFRVIISHSSSKSESMKTVEIKNQFGIDVGYVYFIKSEYGWKIGQAKSWENRKKIFDVKLPFECQFVYTIRSIEKASLEKRLHIYFKEQRINGEWFDITEADIYNAVKALKLKNFRKLEQKNLEKEPVFSTKRKGYHNE